MQNVVDHGDRAAHDTEYPLVERLELAGSVRVAVNPRTVDTLFQDLICGPSDVRFIGVLDTTELFFFDTSKGYHARTAMDLGVGPGDRNDKNLIPGHVKIVVNNPDKTWWRVVCSWDVETGSWNNELSRQIKDHPNFDRMMQRVIDMFNTGANGVS